VRTFSSQAFQKLYRHDWPGNVRELEAVVQKAVLFCRERTIDADAVELGAALPGKKRLRVKKAGVNPRRITAGQIREQLKRHGGNIRQAAGALGVSRNTVYSKALAFGIDIEAFRTDG